jgi:imidazole glycerol-phosphate synthase subunit HisH
MTVGLIAYGLGNLRSVVNALGAVGADVRLVESPDDLAACERLVLPGVGAFGDGMRRLQEGGWIEPLERAVRAEGRPLLGICLGMQLLAEHGTEGGERPGLGWIGGRVEPMRSDDPAIRIPHIGWNDVRIAPGSRLFTGLEDGVSFYFVHSYALHGADGAVAAWCEHGEQFPAAVEHGAIWAAQFHPEKSQGAGLRVLRNFVEAAF